MEDIRAFTQTSLVFLLILLGSLMDLVSFSGTPWSMFGTTPSLLPSTRGKNLKSGRSAAASEVS